MKRLLLLFFITANIFGNNTFAQSPTLQQKLYYTCKVWGFVKYFHSNVSTCHVNWDSVLIAVLPVVESAANDSEFNDALDTMLAAAGPMALSTTYFPDTLPTELKRNRNFGWISNPVFRADVQTILDTIKNNFRPDSGCYVANNTYTTSYEGWLVFPEDNPVLNTNTYLSCPDEYHRLLLMFKYWNIINYFNPYNYILDKPIDTVLFNNVLNMDTVSNSYGLYLAIEKITAELDDIHAWLLTYSNYYDAAAYYPELMIRYIQGKYIVVKSGIPAISIGDAIVSVNGLTTAYLEDSLANRISAGNASVFRWSVAARYILLPGNSGTTLNILYADTSGAIDSTIVTEDTYITDPWFPQYYLPTDSLYTINWTTMGCNIGYINTANITSAIADKAYAALNNASAIIVDLRNTAADNYGMLELVNDMLAAPQYFSKFTEPDVTYPGTFYWYLDTIGLPSNPSPYAGTVILLLDEETLSHTEFFSMPFSAMPKVIKIGSQTAGADGNITYFQLTQDIRAGFTSLGTYYPNGDSTQRIGIVPDSVVTPTVAGIMAGRDEVLEKALQVACATASVPNIVPDKMSVTVFPDPATTSLTITATDRITNIIITDLLGQTVYSNQYNTPWAALRTGSVQADVSNLPSGLYFIKINGTEVRKFVKE